MGVRSEVKRRGGIRRGEGTGVGRRVKKLLISLAKSWPLPMSLPCFFLPIL